MRERCSDFLDGSPDGLTTLGLCSHPRTTDDAVSENELDAVFYKNVQIGYLQLVRDYDVHYVLGVNNLFEADTPVSYSASLNGYEASSHEIPESRFIYLKLVFSKGKR